jgi:hypothetical protein
MCTSEYWQVTHAQSYTSLENLSESILGRPIGHPAGGGFGALKLLFRGHPSLCYSVTTSYDDPEEHRAV